MRGKPRRKWVMGIKGNKQPKRQDFETKEHGVAQNDSRLAESSETKSKQTKLNTTSQK